MHDKKYAEEWRRFVEGGCGGNLFRAIKWNNRLEELGWVSKELLADYGIEVVSQDKKPRRMLRPCT